MSAAANLFQRQRFWMLLSLNAVSFENPQIQRKNSFSLMTITRLLAAALIVATAACAARAPVSVFEKRLPLLIWLGEFTRPAGTEYPPLTNSARFGSLSGLAADEASKSWIAVS